MSSGESAYNFIKRMASDISFFRTVMADPEAALANSGIADPADIFVVRQVISAAAQSSMPPEVQASYAKDQSEMLQMYKKSQQSTMSTVEELKESLRRTLRQIDEGFRSTKMMYQVSFYLGVFLILLAAALAVFRGTEFLSTVFGSLGIADFIAFFITKPPEALEKSRADLAQLQMAIFGWFNDSYNWNSLLAQENAKGKVDLEYLRTVSEAMLDSTHRTMSDIEAYCKFVVKPTDDKMAGEKSKPDDSGKKSEHRKEPEQSKHS